MLKVVACAGGVTVIAREDGKTLAIACGDVEKAMGIARRIWARQARETREE